MTPSVQSIYIKILQKALAAKATKLCEKNLLVKKLKKTCIASDREVVF